MEFVTAEDKATAIEYLARHGAAAAILAGGTDLMRQIARGDRKPDSVLYIGALRQLALVERQPGQGPRIGALATQRDLADCEIFSADYQALRQAAVSCGSCQSRNVGTLGGNLCNASPQADLVPALLVHDAVVTLESRERGARTLPLGEFIGGPASTSRLPDELLTGVDLDGSPPRTADTYIKVGRRGAMEVAIVGLAVRVTVSASGHTLDDIRIGVGGIGPKAFRATEAESILRGQSPSDELIRDAAAAVLRQAAPTDNVLATANYRIGLVPGILARGLKGCVERAGRLAG
jgi:carbon-monoxide dehydrogenase medium subunit